jgi:hypothetical protein
LQTVSSAAVCLDDPLTISAGRPRIGEPLQLTTVLVDELPVAREDAKKEARMPARMLADEFGRAQRFPAARPDLPFDVVEGLRGLGGEDRRDLLATTRDTAALPQNRVGRDQTTQRLEVAVLLRVQVGLKEGRELATGLLAGIDRDRLPSLDVAQRDVAAAVEVLVADG